MTAAAQQARIRGKARVSEGYREKQSAEALRVGRTVDSDKPPVSGGRAIRAKCIDCCAGQQGRYVAVPLSDARCGRGGWGRSPALESTNRRTPGAHDAADATHGPATANRRGRHE